jgi:uncharacterized protein YqhQ
MSVGTKALQVAVRITTGAEMAPGQIRSTLAVLGASVLVVFVALPGGIVGAAGYVGTTGDVLEATGRLAMFVVYLFVAARSAAARRLFSYHGAEHKTIAAFERSGALPAGDDVRAASPIHPRCGTNFLTLSLIVAGVLYWFVPRVPVWAGIGWRVLLAPVVAALAYEVMRSAARAGDALWARAVTWPGRLAQRVTTREPTDDQIEVARAALAELMVT